jgi:hypothetical protein
MGVCLSVGVAYSTIIKGRFISTRMDRSTEGGGRMREDGRGMKKLGDWGIGGLLERLPAAINPTEIPETRKTSPGQKVKEVYEIP